MFEALFAPGMEPRTLVNSHVSALGLAMHSALAAEVSNIIHALYLNICIDRLNPYQSGTMEHLGRRLVQVTVACRTTGKAPDFDGKGARDE